LECKECNQRIMLAKFYPSTGYYTSNEYYGAFLGRSIPANETHPDLFLKTFNEFLDKHQHGDNNTMWGKYQFKIFYEIPKEKNTI